MRKPFSVFMKISYSKGKQEDFVNRLSITSVFGKVLADWMKIGYLIFSGY